MVFTNKKRKAIGKVASGALTIALLSSVAMSGITANAAGYDHTKANFTATMTRLWMYSMQIRNSTEKS